MAVAFAVAVPVAIVLGLVWALHVPIIARPVLRPRVMLGGAGVVLLVPLGAPLVPLAVVIGGIALVCASVVAATVALDRQAPADPGPHRTTARAQPGQRAIRLQAVIAARRRISAGRARPARARDAS
jgi:hypothetical protein